ncbi:MAG: phosphoglycerate dehydrogenase [Cyclobacteriaceae bacterium]
MPNQYFIIDFDSTFVQDETLDILAEVALQQSADSAEVVAEIKRITELGMDGAISFQESLQRRMSLLKANRSHLIRVIEKLQKRITPSFQRNHEFLQNNAGQIYIISSGFKEVIEPVVAQFGIAADHVLANRLIFDEEDNIVDFDHNNILSQNKGKVKQLQKLDLEGEIFVIGDGYTDYEMKSEGVATEFYAFTENVRREKVVAVADEEAPTLEEFLYQNNLDRAISYPKNRISVLLLENVHPRAVNMLRKEGYQVQIHASGLDEDELCEKIKNVSILGIRSKTQVTNKVVESANRLIAIGAFCIGTNQIDLEACSKKGVAVFNAPFSNTRSVVELVIGEIIMLMRNLPDKIMAMHQRHWNKSAKDSFEIRGKKLGIIGYGNIGAQLSVLAESMGMQVYFYDIIDKLALGNATPCQSLNELLSLSDVISIHVDGRKENRYIIGEREFEAMKEGVILMNLSRGHVVEIDALRKYIENGKVKGAAIDVFPEEPKNNDDAFESELIGLPNTILTPHIGGSTLEAQENIATYVPGKIIEYINTGSTTNSVNFPNLQLPTLKNAHRLIHVHRNVPGILAKINNVLADHEINIEGQYLKTNELIGYVITDIATRYDDEVLAALKEIEGTIKVRILY